MIDVSEIPVVIFAGGKGTRLGAVTLENSPKPLVKLGRLPLIVHLISSFYQQGFRRFILCTGYKHDEFIRYFSNFDNLVDELFVLQKNDSHNISKKPIFPNLDLKIIYTGENTQTSGRLFKVRECLADRDFVLTYGDGLSDIQMIDVINVNRKTNTLCTISGVVPPGRFGELQYQDNMITGFSEKPKDIRRRINGGFMFIKKEFISTFLSENMDQEPLEELPLQSCANANQLSMYAHDGFWQCMDNPRDYEFLTELVESEQWKKLFRATAG